MWRDLADLSPNQFIATVFAVCTLSIASVPIGQAIGGVGSLIALTVPLVVLAAATAAFRWWWRTRDYPQVTRDQAAKRHLAALRQSPTWQQTLYVAAITTTAGLWSASAFNKITPMALALVVPPVLAIAWALTAILMRLLPRRRGPS
jgi:Na+/H+ antiporter NhaD/arsenite permease-like protein